MDGSSSDNNTFSKNDETETNLWNASPPEDGAKDEIIANQSSSASTSSSLLGKNNSNNNDKKMFYTTSDLMKTMNDTFASVMGNDNNNNDDDETKPMVELQRRLPNGTTKRADEADLAAADLQSKIKQAAQMTCNLSPDKKIEWAKEQRGIGNELYSEGKYRDAMDVYVTCLVGMDDADNGSKGEDNRHGDGKIEEKENAFDDDNDKNDGDAQKKQKTKAKEHAESVREIKLPVLLNLSLCAIQLKMGKKAEQFCNFALESLPTKYQTNKNNGTAAEIDASAKTTDDFDEDAEFASKAYFRRAKARIIMGKYKAAKSDLEKSLAIMQQQQGTTKRLDDNNSDTTAAAAAAAKANNENKIEAVKKEMRKLDALQRAAIQNKRKHEKAVRVVLGGESSSSTTFRNVSSSQPSTLRRRRHTKQEDTELDDLGAQILSSYSLDVATPSARDNSSECTRQSGLHHHHDDTKNVPGEAEQQPQRRAYSTLRSNKKKYAQPPKLSRVHRGSDDYDDEDDEISKEEKEAEKAHALDDCFQWFILSIIRCLRYTLYLLGDDDPASALREEEEEDDVSSVNIDAAS